MVRGHLPANAAAGLRRAGLPRGQQDDYFDRAELYREDGEDYNDNCERFVFFCRAVLEAIQLLDLQRRRGSLPRLADRA